MDNDNQDWRSDVVRFLSENLPKATDGSGWYDNASTAYQIGCMALVKLGFADATDWGAVRKDSPEQPRTMPRWDDICISILWLANQKNKLSFRLPDGSLPPNSIGNGFVIVKEDPPPPPVPNITARFGLGHALCDGDVLLLLQKLGLVSNGGWTQQSEFILWRTSPQNWSLDFLDDERFLDAVQQAIATIPDDIAAEIAELTEISEEHIDELLALNEESLAEAREKFGPKARIRGVTTRAQALHSLGFSRRHAINWRFFRRWRIDDGWLSKKDAEATLAIFHDSLAISMRKSVVKGLYPSKPQFSE